MYQFIYVNQRTQHHSNDMLFVSVPTNTSYNTDHL